MPLFLLSKVLRLQSDFFITSACLGLCWCPILFGPKLPIHADRQSAI